MLEAEFWVAVAFVLFVGVLGYFQVHKQARQRASTTAGIGSRPSSTRRAG